MVPPEVQASSRTGRSLALLCPGPANVQMVRTHRASWPGEEEEEEEEVTVASADVSQAAAAGKPTRRDTCAAAGEDATLNELNKVFLN